MLSALTKLSLKNKFKFKKHVIKDEGGGLDDEADDMDGDDLDGRADMADEVHAAESEGEIDEDMDFGVGGGMIIDAKLSTDELYSAREALKRSRASIGEGFRANS